MFAQSTVVRKTSHNVWDFETIVNIAVSYSNAKKFIKIKVLQRLGVRTSYLHKQLNARKAQFFSCHVKPSHREIWLHGSKLKSALSACLKIYFAWFFVHPEWQESVFIFCGWEKRSNVTRHWDVCSLLSAIETPFMRRVMKAFYRSTL